MLDIIYDILPYFAIPLHHADDDTEYYTLNNIIEDSTLIKVKKAKKIIVPLFDQKFSKEFKNYKDSVDFWSREIKKRKKIPNNIIKLFTNEKCNKLIVISTEESFIVSSGSSPKSINCNWSRKVGYLGSKLI